MFSVLDFKIISILVLKLIYHSCRFMQYSLILLSIFKHDVDELQKQLKSSSMSPAGRKVGNIVYLVLDTPALCRHLSLLRSLVKSAQFVVIVPIQGRYKCICKPYYVGLFTQVSTLSLPGWVVFL